MNMPYVLISELSFDDSGWTLELGFYDLSRHIKPYDSVQILSSTGSVTLKQLALRDSGEDLLVLHKTDFNPTMDINKLGDVVNVIAYFPDDGETSTNTLAFGTSNAGVDAPAAGESIVRPNLVLAVYGSHIPLPFYTQCNHPSPGLWNDTTGCFGKMKGVVYGKDAAPVPGVTFKWDYYFTTGDDGSYETPIFARNTTISTLRYLTIKGMSRDVNIDNYSYYLRPDQQLVHDIYLADALLLDVDEPAPLSQNIISFYPNPFTTGNSIAYHTILPVKSAKLKIELFDEGGKLVKTEYPDQQEGHFTLPDHLKNGVYFLNLSSGVKLYASTKIALFR